MTEVEMALRLQRFMRVLIHDRAIGDVKRWIGLALEPQPAIVVSSQVPDVLLDQVAAELARALLK